MLIFRKKKLEVEATSYGNERRRKESIDCILPQQYGAVGISNFLKYLS